MTKEFSLVEAMDEYVVRPRELYKSRPGLYPSEASVCYELDGRKVTIGKCLRASWYRLQPDVTGEETGGAGLQMKALIGKWDEMAIIDTIKKMGLFFDNNVKFFYAPLTMSGELDMVITNPLTGGKILYEIKSYYGHYANTLICGTRPKSYKTVPNKLGIPGKPKDNQFLQTSLYAWEYKDQVEETRMLYIERGDGHRVEFKVGTVEDNGKNFCYWEQVPGPYWSHFEAGKKIQPYTIEDVHDRYRQLQKYAVNKDVPPMDFEAVWSSDKIEWAHKNGLVSDSKYNKYLKKKENIGDWQCSWCQYKKQCEEDFMRYGK